MAKLAKRLIPLLDRVLVEKISAPAQSVGGVLIPENLKGKLNEGKVLAVGPGALNKDGDRIKPSVKEGDTVLLPEYGGNSVKVEGKEMFLYREEDILAVVQED
eukprot:CAMPEP_0196657760 /NCGR_PEP_ID=MMETSP1086-20130531/25347_1 /TAXON_ID=77921 /ORGANISM="Cyanoptyche  gloeocystis , Strain SAG4.97" /LENGTH=102 /DNA_ID=CAMNT_0041991019 /DNA_START=74 /DNA_END=382 /DNA_ORIENTATION=+